MFPPWAQRGGLQREREKARKPLVVSGLGKALGDVTQPVQVLCGLVFGKKKHPVGCPGAVWGHRGQRREPGLAWEGRADTLGCAQHHSSGTSPKSQKRK